MKKSPNVIDFLQSIPEERAQSIRMRGYGKFLKRHHQMQLERKRQEEKREHSPDLP